MNVTEIAIFAGQVILILIFVYLIGIAIRKPKITEGLEGGRSNGIVTREEMRKNVTNWNTQMKDRLVLTKYKTNDQLMLDDIIESQNLIMLNRIIEKNGSELLPEDIDFIIKTNKYKEAMVGLNLALTRM